jgi:cytochrome c biogenesis protein CcmG/thiol:disulfide interchange protein DsbE
MTRRLRLLGWTALIGVAAVALVVLGFASKGSTRGGAPAPELPREHLVGPASTSLSTLLRGAAGRPVAVVFWASWCDPCAAEAPALERFARSASGSGRIVGVDWSDGLSGARAFISSHGWTFPNLRDSEGIIGSRYGLISLPTTFVLSGNGRIHMVLRGPQTEASLTHALAAASRS